LDNIFKANKQFQAYLEWLKEPKNTVNEAKQTKGKPRLSLVPFDIVYAIEKVRQFGIKEYKDPDNWKTVPIEKFYDALFRHIGKILMGETIDHKSGLPHTFHASCNLSFIIHLEKHFRGERKVGD